MKQASLYLDASAAAKLLFLEPEVDALRRELAAAQAALSSEIIEIELACASRRRAGQGLGRVGAVMRGIELVPLTERIRARAAGPWDPPQRALDALHLATALELGLDDLVLITYDAEQAAAGAAAGLPVLTPT